jgi:hypothetical protein
MDGFKGVTIAKNNPTLGESIYLSIYLSIPHIIMNVVAIASSIIA